MKNDPTETTLNTPEPEPIKRKGGFFEKIFGPKLTDKEKRSLTRVRASVASSLNDREPEADSPSVNDMAAVSNVAPVRFPRRSEILVGKTEPTQPKSNNALPPHHASLKELIDKDDFLAYSVNIINRVTYLLKNMGTVAPSDDYVDALGYNEENLENLMHALMMEMREEYVTKGQLSSIFHANKTAVEILYSGILGLQKESTEEEKQLKLDKFKSVISKYDELLAHKKIDIIRQIESARIRSKNTKAVKELVKKLNIDASEKPLFDEAHVQAVLEKYSASPKAETGNYYSTFYETSSRDPKMVEAYQNLKNIHSQFKGEGEDTTALAEAINSAMGSSLGTALAASSVKFKNYKSLILTIDQTLGIRQDSQKLNAAILKLSRIFTEK